LLWARHFLAYLVGCGLLSHRGFEFSDLDVPAQLVQNPSIRGLSVENVVRIFTTASYSSYYPIRSLSFALDYQLWASVPADSS